MLLVTRMLARHRPVGEKSGMRGRAPAAIIAVAVVGAVLAISAAPATASKSTRCQLRGSKTIVKTSSGRVFSKPGVKKLSGGQWPVVRYYGCLFSSGKRYSLGFNAEDPGFKTPFVCRVSSRSGSPAGTQPAWSSAVVKAPARRWGCLASRPEDRRRGARRHPGPGAKRRPGQPVREGKAWTTGRRSRRHPRRRNGLDCPLRWPDACPCSAPCRVIKSDRDGRTVLDEASGIRALSLKLRGSTVSWIRDGTRRTATLR